MIELSWIHIISAPPEKEVFSAVVAEPAASEMPGPYGSAGGILRADSEKCRNCSQWCTYELNPPVPRSVPESGIRENNAVDAGCTIPRCSGILPP